MKKKIQPPESPVIPGRDEVFYQMLLDTSMDGFWENDTHGIIHNVNRVVCDLLGYTREEMIGMNVSEIEVNESLEDVITHIEMIRSKRADRFESRHRHKNGEIIDVEISLQFLPLNGGRVYCFIRDIREQKRTFRLLKYSGEKFSTAFQNAPLLLTISEFSSGRFIDVNEKFLEVSGFTREEVLGKTSVEVGWVSDDDRIRLMERIREVGRVDGIEMELRCRNGEKVSCIYHGEQMDVEGTTLLLSMALDVTSKKRAEEKLQKSQLLLRQSQMSPHFIFNAISSIQSYVLKNDPEKAIRFLRVFAKMIRSTLDFATRHFISLAEELEYLDCYIDIENLRFEQLFSKNIVIDPAVDLIKTSIPPMMIQPLVENAIRHGLIHRNKQGILTLELRKHNEHDLLLIIEDNGVGRARAAEIEGDKSYESKATRIIEERIRLLNESHPQSRFGIEYIDLHEVDGTPAGTRVELRMSLHNS
jgi:PAS domain S-box-containing protein